MKIVNQIERVLKHCQKVNKEYESSNHNQDCIDYNINKGWIEALKWVLNTMKNGSPVSDKPLNNRGDE